MLEKVKFPEIKKIIAVASGKGGVGKSTVSANLAFALNAAGYKTAIYDADIYGPSVPIIFGLEGHHPEVIEFGEDEMIKPAIKDGIQIMSIGFFLDPAQPAIWRGPAASAYLKKFLCDTMWKDVDYLIIDLPPGTGDLVLTLCQEIPLDAAIIVTTPQKLSLADVRKSIGMFQHPSIDVPILGVVENMSWFTPAEHPDEQYRIFGKGGGKYLADHFKTELLAEIPLVDGMCEAADLGIMNAYAENPIIKREFAAIISSIIPKLNVERKAKAMKICIPTEEPMGLDSVAYGHFGSAPYFLIYDTETKEIEVIKNNEDEHEHGQCNPVAPIRDKGVKALMVAGMGSGALQKFVALGINVYKIETGTKVRTIVENLDLDKMEQLVIDNCCQGHSCH